MAYYNSIKTPSVTERALEWAAHMLENAALRHARYRIYRTSLIELSALSDRELSDLGMHRSSLKSIAMQTAMKQVAL